MGCLFYGYSVPKMHHFKWKVPTAHRWRVEERQGNRYTLSWPLPDIPGAGLPSLRQITFRPRSMFTMTSRRFNMSLTFICLLEPVLGGDLSVWVLLSRLQTLMSVELSRT